MIVLFTMAVVFIILVFFMAVVFKAKELKARKGARAGADSYCCGKCGSCEKELPPAP